MNQVFHVGTGHGTRVDHIARTVGETLGKEDLIRYEQRAEGERDMPVQTADPSKMHSVFERIPSSLNVLKIREITRWWLARVKADTSSISGAPI